MTSLVAAENVESGDADAIVVEDFKLKEIKTKTK